ncbi:DUF4380 domain-containing protein [Nocardiopsis ansamitocini]|uniref:DUF4380 domain-containing protein n=1 Tax=Nocardiopsis ansamitocini TaxID=1670832 RepID=A0A9W6PA68_9ACTN|nr:DUF4380 domain-containing protein [Nocardiopsis ansamitocini]GLU49980.1 hypothetical protein Nans01_43310 [Nocardiopsis ansamitocini]
MSGAVRVEHDTTGPYEVVYLDNGVLRLGVVPALGGRLLSALHRGTEFLYRNPRLLGADLHPVDGERPAPTSGPMSAWRNFGGDKTWPAPQGWDGPHEWAGPPDPVLDSGEYDRAVATGADGAVTLTLTSGDDPRTGLRLRRRLTLAPGRSGYRLELTAHNTSDTPRRWALWNVTQLGAEPVGHASAQGVYVGTADSADPSAVVPLVAGDANPRVEQSHPGVLRVPAQDVIGKAGFPAATGWLACVGAAGTMTQRFDVVEGAPYPDQGSRAEVWLEYPPEHPLEHLGGLFPADRIVECEALGPLTDLAPGDSTTLTIDAGFGSGTAAVTDVTPDGFWSEPPRLSSTPDGTRLSGAFTAFTRGTLHCRPADGRPRVRLGTALPGLPLRFDTPVPRGTPDAAVEFTPAPQGPTDQR